MTKRMTILFCLMACLLLGTCIPARGAETPKMAKKSYSVNISENVEIKIKGLYPGVNAPKKCKTKWKVTPGNKVYVVEKTYNALVLRGAKKGTVTVTAALPGGKKLKAKLTVKKKMSGGCIHDTVSPDRDKAIEMPE